MSYFDDFDDFDEPTGFITNFGEYDRAVYEAAIAEHGDTRLSIGEYYDDRGTGLTGGSLYWTASRSGEDLGPFWRIFDRIQNERRKVAA